MFNDLIIPVYLAYHVICFFIVLSSLLNMNRAQVYLTWTQPLSIDVGQLCYVSLGRLRVGQPSQV